MARDNTMRFTFSNVTAVYTVNFPASGSTITATSPATAPANNTPVYFTSLSGASGGPTTGIVAQNVYYVTNASGATFNLAPTVGGTAISLTTATTGVTMFIGSQQNTSTSLGGRSGVLRINPSPNQWAIGYSDALNVARFRDQQADQSQYATINSVVSSITGDPAVYGSTSGAEYFLRASVGVAGMFGPAPCQIIVQGANDAGTGVAPSQASDGWLPVSGIGTCAPNATAITFTTAGTTASQIPSTYIGTTPTLGSIFMATGGSGVTLNTPTIVSATSAGAFTLTHIGAGLFTATNTTFASGLIGNFGGRAITLVANASVTSNLLQADIVPQVGDAVFFSAVTATTLSANTLYFVTSVTSAGLFTLSTTFGGTAATVTAVTSGTGITYGFDRIPTLYVTVSGSTFTTVSAAGGSTAVPHGLQVGSVVVLSAGSSLTALALDTAYFVTSVPTATTFTLSATQNGANITTGAVTNGQISLMRASKIVNVQIAKTTRSYFRAALVQLSSSVSQNGYFIFNFADLSIGKDSAQVS